ncbi:MAG: phytoene desaturase [Bacteroidetes bacterium]|nr:phytoene desaturase [Bacteroidota bacterium]
MAISYFRDVKKAVVIGSGFAGLSAASCLAKQGWEVMVVEKNAEPGGRARRLVGEGFVFDMGPSWYWMPDVFEKYFSFFGKKVSDYYTLTRLSPSYRVYFDDATIDMPADYDAVKLLFESLEKGSAAKLDKFLKEAEYKYKAGMQKLVYLPGRSIKEFADMDLAKGVFKLELFTSMKKHVAKYFKNPRLVQIMEFPVLFLGALPQNIPALYSLMNYADIKLGTWYPQGGMYEVVKGMYRLATELGVQFHFNCEAKGLEINNGRASRVLVQWGDGRQQNHESSIDADVFIGAADYHFIENNLLAKNYRSYSNKYWSKRVMAPSCIIYYIGLNKKLKNILHHSLFFDVNFDAHGKAIFEQPAWPAEPLFYVSATSVTDGSSAPPGGENLFFLIPVAAGLQADTEELREKYFEKIMTRFENKTGENIRKNIIFKKSYSVSDFEKDYHAYKGNAYGLANTLLQTAILKPGIKSKKVGNLFYAGQLTVPGPGVPPSLISGQVVATEIVKEF